MNFYKNAETIQKMVKNMDRPKTITQLSREQLEDFCLSLFHVDNEKANIIEELELKNEALEKEIKNLKQPTIFIDTQDMEERYGDELYVDYLKEENQSLKDILDELEKWLKDIKEGIEELTIGLQEWGHPAKPSIVIDDVLNKLQELKGDK